ncbi:hypothetical protein CRUP_028588 [Coryphaenoides rupestris]|nr:hypothetical protein CRUP_028588 [Coryphaenoides rupestris]
MTDRNQACEEAEVLLNAHSATAALSPVGTLTEKEEKKEKKEEEEERGQHRRATVEHLSQRQGTHQPIRVK